MVRASVVPAREQSSLNSSSSAAGSRACKQTEWPRATIKQMKVSTCVTVRNPIQLDTLILCRVGVGALQQSTPSDMEHAGLRCSQKPLNFRISSLTSTMRS